MAERFKAPVSTLREQARGFKPRQNQYLGLFFLNETQWAAVKDLLHSSQLKSLRLS